MYMFGQIETLVRKIDYSSMKAEHAIRRWPARGSRKAGILNNAGAGTVNMAVNLENQKLKASPMHSKNCPYAGNGSIGQADKSKPNAFLRKCIDPMMRS